MSAVAFIHMRDEKSDYLFLGSDTAVVRNMPFQKDGIQYPEKFVGLSTKSLYVPHVKTLVSVVGNTWLSRKLHDFIDDSGGLTGFDDVLVGVKYVFHDYYKKAAKDVRFTTDPDHDDFLGGILLSGPSYKQIVDFGSPLRAKPLLMTRKFLVYKDRVEDAGWMNSEKDDYQGELYEAVQPKLPEEIHNAVVEEAKPVFENGFYLGSIFLLKRWLMENNRLYNESGRTGTVTAGEIHSNIMQLTFDDQGQETFTVSQMMLHRFNDFEEVVKEVRTKK